MASPAELACRVRRGSLIEGVRRALGAEETGEIWLVGGALRDLAAGVVEEPRDLDLALPGSGERLARRIATRLGGSAFPLDEAEGAWRVTLPEGFTVDCIPLRAACIEEDLGGRDFTVNAVAFDLLGDRGLLDPLGGLRDLARHRLRLCSPTSLEEDPVRVLRAYRFAAALGLVMGEQLRSALPGGAKGLERVAPERVRTEFFAVLGLRGAGTSLRAMVEDGVLQRLFPFIEGWRGFDQGDYHAHDLLEHSLRAAEHAAALAECPGDFPDPEALRAHLAAEHEGGITRKALLTCAAFFHDVAKPEALTLDGARRRFVQHEVRGGASLSRLLADLRVGRRACAAARRMVAGHLRLFQLSRQDPPTRRAWDRYLMDLGEEVPEALLLSVADELATGPEAPSLGAVTATAEALLSRFWAQRSRPRVRPLLRGRDLLNELGLGEGPLIGRILKEVQEAEARGELSTRRQALERARSIASKVPK